MSIFNLPKLPIWFTYVLIVLLIISVTLLLLKSGDVKFVYVDADSSKPQVYTPSHLDEVPTQDGLESVDTVDNQFLSLIRSLQYYNQNEVPVSENFRICSLTSLVQFGYFYGLDFSSIYKDFGLTGEPLHVTVKSILKNYPLSIQLTYANKSYQLAGLLVEFVNAEYLIDSDYILRWGYVSRDSFDKICKENTPIMMSTSYNQMISGSTSTHRITVGKFRFFDFKSWAVFDPAGNYYTAYEDRLGIFEMSPDDLFSYAVKDNFGRARIFYLDKVNGERKFK
jgi:hypothetical protein